jgi:hypothetical protein
MQRKKPLSISGERLHRYESSLLFNAFNLLDDWSLLSCGCVVREQRGQPDVMQGKKPPSISGERL